MKHIRKILVISIIKIERLILKLPFSLEDKCRVLRKTSRIKSWLMSPFYRFDAYSYQKRKAMTEGTEHVQVG